MIISQWLSHIDYSSLINHLIKLIIHSSSPSSSMNNLAWLIIRVIDYSTMIRQWSFNQPARVIDYSTMIKSHWLFIRVVNRVQSTNSHDWLFGWLIIQQWFDNDCLINQLAWWIIWQWLSHIDYSWLINQLIKLIVHSSSQSSSINQPAWLIIRVIDYSTMIRQWLFNQPARVIDYSTMIESHWLFIRVVNRVQSTNSHDWLPDMDYFSRV